MGLKFEPLDRRRHNRSSFNCGRDSLDKYIRQQASQDLKKRVASVFVLIDDSNTNIIGYYTLSAYTIEITEMSEKFTKHLPRYPLLPATLLGRLAVDNNYQGKNFGKLILIDALKRALEKSIDVASIVMVAEALDEKAISFYQKYGFQLFKQDPMKLYLPMQLIEQM